MRLGRALAVLTFTLSACAFGQNTQLRTRTGSRFPTVIFTSAFWRADPSYYSIAIDATGAATYQSSSDSESGTGVPYTVEFRVGDRTRRMTFNIAQGLGFFAEPARAPVGSPDNEPVRTLAYGYLQVHNQITFSTSQNDDVDELTSLFEDISETMEFGRRLVDLYLHDKGSLDGELDLMQKSVAARRLREIDAISPVLRRIAGDGRLGTETRHKAEMLLTQPRS